MVDLTTLVAVLVTLVAALGIAGQNLFVRKGTDGGRASDAVVVVIAVNVLVLLPSVAILYYPDYGLTPVSWLSFAAAGMVGTLLGRILSYTSIEKIGASRTAPIVAAWALVSTVFGVIFLDETLSPIHAVGIALVVAGIVVIAWETNHENPDGLSRRELSIGLLIPFAAAFAYGLEPIFAKFGFAEGTPAPVGLVVKTVAAILGLTLYLRLRNDLPGREVLRSNDMRWFVLAGLSNTLFLVGYYVALEIAPVSIVTPIIITNTLFVVVLSALFMPKHLERVTWKLAGAATAVVVGVGVITAFG
ncbi:DMT family transporter (plasmid) [Halorarum halophilum]|uniref:DMT family transporter n=1 Tax=Halorarum halophilum TaxID=2743090 RepID=A0A7D5GP68_9EURY|nr:GRP family sugar transporter [Halobaculum halophilum]QLG29764.1 DMT family transporter [Halobaculum halophilum]